MLSCLTGSGQSYICKDKIPGCKSYTERSDACESNYEFLNAYCQQACGFCGESCPILKLFCHHIIRFIQEICIVYTSVHDTKDYERNFFFTFETCTFNYISNNTLY